MNKACILFFFFCFIGLTAYFLINKAPGSVEKKVILKTKTGEISGVLLTPKPCHKIPVALIIAGSGPTDKNGNSAMTQNNSLQILASELLKHGIASLRYDKRGIGESKAAGKKEEDLRFEDYVDDAIGWVKQLRQDKRFSKVIVIGHSEGSLIGMMAAHDADQFISIAGAGVSIDATLKTQLQTQPKEIKDAAFLMIDTLKKGKKVDQVPTILNPLLPLFRPSVQPYLMSWFQYDPQHEIQALSIPILIVQGTKDIQVSVDDAKALVKANPKGELVLIDKMNHVFRIVKGDSQENLATYSNPSLPIAQELVKSIRNFIFKN